MLQNKLHTCVKRRKEIKRKQGKPKQPALKMLLPSTWPAFSKRERLKPVNTDVPTYAFTNWGEDGFVHTFDAILNAFSCSLTSVHRWCSLVVLKVSWFASERWKDAYLLLVARYIQVPCVFCTVDSLVDYAIDSIHAFSQRFHLYLDGILELLVDGQSPWIASLLIFVNICESLTTSWKVATICDNLLCTMEKPKFNLWTPVVAFL